MKLDKIRVTMLSVISIISVSCMLVCGCGSSGSSGSDSHSTASIQLSSDASTIVADGSSSVSITANVSDAAGVPVEKDTEIIFRTSLGVFRNGEQNYGMSTLDDSGVARVSLISSAAPGTAEIICESSGVSQSLKIQFTHYDNSGLPVAEEFGLSVEYLNFSGLWMTNLENTITAHLGDIYGNAVQDGIPVHFKTYNTGGFFDPDIAVTAGLTEDITGETAGDDIGLYKAGIAVSTLFSTPSPAPAQGFVSLTAETEGGATTHITSIEVTPGYDHNIIYAGTNGGGIYKSTDSGRNWENISRSTLNARAGENWIDPYIKGHSAICVDPDDHNTVYAGTGYLGQGRLFRSLDGGMNWNSNNIVEWNGLFNADSAVLSVLCDDGNNDYVWIGTEGHGIFFAEDGEDFQPAGSIVNVSARPFSGGDIVSIRTGFSTKTETWTISSFIPQSAGSSAPVSIEDIVAPPNKGTVINVSSLQTEQRETWTLECIYNDVNAAPPLLGDTSTIFSVKGSVSGIQANANVNTPYSSDAISFLIIPGQSPFIVGDVITFETVPGGSQTYEYWTVQGSVSGMQAGIAKSGTNYTSDNGEISFTIQKGSTPFKENDTFIVQTETSDNTLSHGWTIWDIEKVPDTHGKDAVLYAATSAGVYKSTNGGRTWSETGSFTGDFVTSLELFHTGNGFDILYAGTENSSVWVSTDSGAKWDRYSDGLGMGTCIKDILLDKYNHKLYAAAWYGPRETATGTIFVHDLTNDLTMVDGAWYSADNGLSGAALYALACDDPEDYAGELFTGGEGISLHKTSGDISTGAPLWQESDAGMSNLIMARIPVLFSGVCSMDYKAVINDDILFLKVYIQDRNGNPPIKGSTFKATYHNNQSGESFNIEDFSYPDTYTFRGTCRDPGNDTTNIPFQYRIQGNSGDTIDLEYNPACNNGEGGEEGAGAGCSGSAEQKITLYF